MTKFKSGRSFYPHAGSKKAAFFIALFLLQISGARMYGATLDEFQFCTDCLELDISGSIFIPGEQPEISWRINSEKLDTSGFSGNTPVDAYVAEIDPGGNVTIAQKLSGLVSDIGVNGTSRIAELPENSLGQHQVYFVLVPLNINPFDYEKWLSAANSEFIVLPENWQRASSDQIVETDARKMPGVIGHGGGALADLIVTNSLQALDQAFAQGQSYVEIDFNWTSDGELVAVHDWDRNFRLLFKQSFYVPTLAEFNVLEMVSGLTQINFTQLLDWLAAHPDVYIITDIKESNIAGLQYIAERSGDRLQQFIPQIYQPTEFDQVSNLGFSSQILTLYRNAMSNTEVSEFVADKNGEGSQQSKILAVTMPIYRALSGDLVAMLNARSVFVYVHTVNNRAVFDYLKSLGVGGVYSDVLSVD